MSRARKEKATKKVTLPREKIRGRRLAVAQLKKELGERLTGRYLDYAAGLAKNLPYNLKPSTRRVRDKINLRLSSIYMAELCLKNASANLSTGAREQLLYYMLQPLLGKMRQVAMNNPYTKEIPVGDMEKVIAGKMGPANIARIEAKLQRHSAILGLDKMDRVEMGVKEHTLLHGFDLAKSIMAQLKKNC